MLWFKKKAKGDTETMHDARVEVVVHQQATQAAVDEAVEQNERVLDSLKPNHITLTLWVAAGGNLQKTTRKHT